MSPDLDAIICLRPFYSLELNIRGDVSVCCPAWVKGMVGNTKKKSLQEIWNDEPIQHMRRMMLEGRWSKICRPNCPHIMAYRLTDCSIPLKNSTNHVITEEILTAIRSRQTVLTTGPTLLNLANSTTCNLNCIMCGREHHKDDAALIDRTMQQVTELLPSLRELFLTGNGDPFARPDTRKLLLDLPPSQYPDLKINLLTNGLLLPRYWERIKHINFGYLNISVDAATRESYEKIRRGGKWLDLVKTLELVGNARDHFSFTMINMTVMKENYREIPAFVRLAHSYGLRAGITRVRGKWGDQNIFTAGDQDVTSELRHVITEARQLAEELEVFFDSSAFEEIMMGKEQSSRERYQQRAIDLMRYLYYKLKP